MKKMFCYILCLVILLAGCGKNPETQNSHETDAGTLFMGTNSEAKTYMAETWDAGITPDYQPLSNSFVLTEEMLYYADRSEGLPTDIWRVALSEQGQPMQRMLRLEDGYIEAIAEARGTDGESILALVCKDGTGASLLAAYTMDGRQLWHQSYEAQGQIAFCLVQDDSGCFYAMHEDRVYLFDADGVCQGSVSCPGESYIDICAVAGDGVYVSYRDGQAEHPMLARLQYQGGRLEGELRISGNGYLGAGREGSLLFQNGNEVYVSVPQKQEAERLLDLTAYDLAGEQLQAMRMTSSGEIVLASWELLHYDSPVWVTRLREAEEGQLAEDGRQIITWLVVSSKEDAEQIATAFNRQSKDYKVVVEQVSLEGMTLTDSATQFDIYAEIYICINTRLLASKSADLISFSSYQDMERYLAKGYLEDLTPYIARSEKISREDYFDEILECYSSGNALYSIPPTFGIDTLTGKESELGAEPGWTVDEFLDWIAEHPDAVTWEGLSRENVLNLCLKGTLNEYLDWESGQCDFEGEDFQELLRRIGGLTTDSAEHWDLWEQMKEKPGIEYSQSGVSGFLDCRSWENMYGEPLVYKGYPSKDGTPCYYYTGGGLAILSRSTCKEGAYAFWEYYLLEESKSKFNVFNDDRYYTNREAYAGSMHRVTDWQYAYREDGTQLDRRLSELPPEALERDDGLVWRSYMSEEERDKQLALLEHVQTDSLDNQAIRNMICEEASYYFAGVKNLEDTCRVIQSRVRLYLAERLDMN